MTIRWKAAASTTAGTGTVARAALRTLQGSSRRVGTYMYGEADNEIAVHLYCDSAADLKVAGQSIKLRQTTIYPLDGKIRLTVEPEAPVEFTLALRIPAWSPKATIRVNGQQVEIATTEDKRLFKAQSPLAGWRRR